MLKIKEYVKAESLEQAYELNQKRTNCILGGMLWLKMSTDHRPLRRCRHPPPDAAGCGLRCRTGMYRKRLICPDLV